MMGTCLFSPSLLLVRWREPFDLSSHTFHSFFLALLEYFAPYNDLGHNLFSNYLTRVLLLKLLIYYWTCSNNILIDIAVSHQILYLVLQITTLCCDVAMRIVELTNLFLSRLLGAFDMGVNRYKRPWSIITLNSFFSRIFNGVNRA